ncbi:TetR/AcrR family transcriptional regulator [Burkholderia contaminans]|nr:TetR/AcrR family transcriptional regulator [Burkholderia contaminans]
MNHKGRGRPREFDMDEVLDKAIGVFRTQGYRGTSISDLADATGLASGSLYKAFRVKDAVYRAAFDRYNHVRDTEFKQLLETEKTGREKIRDLVMLYVENSSGERGSQGCLIVGGAVEFSTLEADTGKYVEDALARLEKLISKLIKIGQADGSIPDSIEIRAASRCLLCLLQGLRVVGKTRPTRRETAAAADLALKIVS